MNKENFIDQHDNADLTLIAIKNFNLAFNNHDVDGVMNCMTEDCVFENTNPMPDGTRLEGAIAIREYWGKFFTSNPDARFEAEEVFATDNRCVVRWVYHKTKDGKPGICGE